MVFSCSPSISQPNSYRASFDKRAFMKLLLKTSFTLTAISETFPSGIWNPRGKFTQRWKSENVMSKNKKNISQIWTQLWSISLPLLKFWHMMKQGIHFTCTFRMHEILSFGTFSLLYLAMVVLAFKSTDKIPMFVHSNWIYAVYMFIYFSKQNKTRYFFFYFGTLEMIKYLNDDLFQQELRVYISGLPGFLCRKFLLKVCSEN